MYDYNIEELKAFINHVYRHAVRMQDSEFALSYIHAVVNGKLPMPKGINMESTTEVTLSTIKVNNNSAGLNHYLEERDY